MFDRIGFNLTRILTLASVLGAGLVFSPPGAAGQTTWYVDDDAPNDPEPGDPGISDPDEDGSAEHPFDAIQEGIYATVDSDEVVVADGTYTGQGNSDLDFEGKTITVRSANGPESCIIDCEANGRGVNFHSGETANALLDGLTVMNGEVVGGDGGGVRCANNSNPTIIGCMIFANVADAGGGVLCNESSPTLVNCLIADNTALVRGGGMLCQESSATITNCTITGNDGANGGGGAQVAVGSNVAITNCIFSGNTASEGPQIRVLGSSNPSTLTVSYTDIVGGPAAIYVHWACTLNWGDGNIDAEPELAADGVHLRDASPCIDAGTNSPPGGLLPYDIEGTPRPLDGDGDIEPWSGQAETSDMGVDEYGIVTTPTICVAPTTFEFFAYEGDPEPSDQTLSIWNCGTDTLDWEIVEDCSWLSADPLVGSSDGEIDEVTLSVDAAGFPPGHYGCAFDVVSPQAPNSPRTVPATLHVGGSELHVPSEFPTIQAAIDAAVPGDVVIVADGTYTGPGNRDLDFCGKAITVRSENGPENCIIDCQAGWPDYHRGFHFHSMETQYALLDGFTITGGYAEDGGGGICCENSSPMITNCTLTDNGTDEYHWYGGGAICSRGGGPTITNCTITENRSSNGWDGTDGGGVYFAEGGTPVIAHCTITENVAAVGGGVYCDQSDAIIADCTIARNTAAVHHGGGGGAGICCYGGSATISNCTITGNVGWDFWWGGAGISCGGSTTISGCTITRNVATWCGAGICCGGNPIILNCTVADNLVLAESGAGGGIYCAEWSHPTIANSAILGNTARLGGGLCCAGGSPTVTNCMMWGNTTDEICVYSGSNPVITYCDVQGGWPGEGNIDADPLLIRDGIHMWGDSPCIDAGDPNGDYSDLLDVDGEPRVADGRVDIGPDEFHDQDDDGLPDWWELLHFDSPTAGEPTADDDTDGLSNLEEYGQLRDPNQAPRSYYVDLAGDDAWDGLAPDWDGQHGPKATIQAAIDVTDPHEGDEVVVADGAYTGDGNRDIAFDGKAITVRSANGPDNCIIDCRGSAADPHRGFEFHSGEEASSVLAGLTITSGFGPDEYVIGWLPWSVGGAVFCRISSPTIRNCTITGNALEEVDGSGTICCYFSSAQITKCMIRENRAVWGAGLQCYYGSPTITNCEFVGNSAQGDSGSHGGGASCYESNATFINCTFTGSTASTGAGIYGDGGQLTISDCIFWGNLPDQIHSAYGTILVTYSDIQGGWPGVGNIDLDPLFVDADGPDDDPNTWEDNDYHLKGNSPCIDAGDNDSVPAWVTTDLDGRLRFADRIATPDSGNPGVPGPPIVDMGPYEYQCTGDLDGDGEIDLSDLAALLAHYGTTSAAVYADGDLDQDADVDLADLATLLAAYGVTCE